jgi:hypothetical protein
MGFMDLFVEKIPEETPVIYEEDYVVEEDYVDVNTENVTQDNLIADIYTQNELSDLSKSIFKIEELINSLPKEMPNETKKTTVLSMLSIFGLTVDEILADGEQRSCYIKAALTSITDENNEVINNNNANIEQKKLEIQDLEKDNADRTIVIKNAEEKVESEVERINSLIKFIIGGKA